MLTGHDSIYTLVRKMRAQCSQGCWWGRARWAARRCHSPLPSSSPHSRHTHASSSCSTCVYVHCMSYRICFEWVAGLCRETNRLRSQSRQSAKLFLQSSELRLPHPFTRRRVCPPFGSGGRGGTLAEVEGMV
jgi:hypothetical protein